jgi:hypothetical protein
MLLVNARDEAGIDAALALDAEDLIVLASMVAQRYHRDLSGCKDAIACASNTAAGDLWRQWTRSSYQKNGLNAG